ncbi:MAG: HNH endonuclease signature motif containing protein [Crinalium sp.]
MKRDDIIEQEAQIRKWIKEHRSKAFICSQLHCKPLTLESYLAKLNIVYKGNQGSRGRNSSNKKPVTNYLYKGSTISTHRLKLKLLEDGLKVAECELCHTNTWLDGNVPLELHHINGDRHDNSLENLQVLCPNCHALTDNHAGKARQSDKQKLSLPSLRFPQNETEPNQRFISVLVFDSAESKARWNKIPLALRQLVNNEDGSYSCQFAQGNCLSCGKLLISPTQDTYCSQKCFKLASRRVVRPSKEELEKIIWTKPTSQIANDFGVSDKAVEKWCKAYGIHKPPRGYWAKQRSPHAFVAK